VKRPTGKGKQSTLQGKKNRIKTENTNSLANWGSHYWEGPEEKEKQSKTDKSNKEALGKGGSARGERGVTSKNKNWNAEYGFQKRERDLREDRNRPDCNDIQQQNLLKGWNPAFGRRRKCYPRGAREGNTSRVTCTASRSRREKQRRLRARN